MVRRAWCLLLTALVCTLALPSCAESDAVEEFVRRDEARAGVYVYSLPLADTTVAYDFWFYSRSVERPLQSVQMNVQWLAPSGEAFSETVYMRRIDPKGSKELYRSGVVPAQAGDWQLSVRPVGAGEELLGLGIIYKKQDGTR
ncbi:MAG: hypothetical protein K6A62_04060 [Bacteroidales bacterium]|nr:hypothetical protein [Bacteroidales bacterium]